MSKHISEQFEEELQTARNLLMQMGGLVEKQVKNAFEALMKQSQDLASDVQDTERRINGIEKQLDDLCVHIIARRQPAASDLRMTISIMRASSDLERVGDEAERIAKFALDGVTEATNPDLEAQLRELCDRVAQMVTRTLDAFARGDADVARDVIQSDAEVDRRYRLINAELIARLREQTIGVDHGLNLVWTARALERIGDHAKNIGEYVIYLVSGEDVRHGKPGQAIPPQTEPR